MFSEFYICCCPMSPSFQNGLNYLLTRSGLILAASKVKGGIAKYIGNQNPILSKNIQFSPKLELSRRWKLIFLPVFAFLGFRAAIFGRKCKSQKLPH